MKHLGKLLIFAAFAAPAVAQTVPEIADMPRPKAALHSEVVCTGVVTIAYSWIPMSGVMAPAADPNGRAAYFSGYVPESPRGRLIGADQLAAGDIIEVRGVVTPFMVDPGIDARTVTKIGHLQLPDAPVYTYERVAQRTSYNRRARLEGVVRGFRKRHSGGVDSLLLDLEIDGGVVPVNLRDLSVDPAKLMDEDVVAEGILLPVITIGHEALYPELELIGKDALRRLSPGLRYWRRFWRALRVAGPVLLIPTILVLLWIYLSRRQAMLRARAVASARQRIAGELDDSIAKSLMRTKDLLGSVVGEVDFLPPRAQESLRAASDLLDSTRNDIRAAINDLRNDDLLTKPMDRLLRSLGVRLARIWSVTIDFGACELPRKLPLETKRDALAIIQEAVGNAARHGGAKKIEINARLNGSAGFEIVVANDGAPFDPEAAMRGRFGIVGMRERARRSGFQLTIDGRNCRTTICK